MAADSTGILDQSGRRHLRLPQPFLIRMVRLLSERVQAKAIKLSNAEVKQPKESSHV